MKKIFFISVMILFFVFSFSVNENEAEKIVHCDNEGNFTILIVSDPQCDTEKQWYEARNEIEILINKSNPNLVIINGDMNSNNNVSKEMWEIFINPITKRNIYWATTNGNHDFFNYKNYQMYKTYDGCLNSLVNRGNINYETKRPMNYVIPIYSQNKQNIIFAVYCMDTGTNNEYGYEGLTKKQIEWYKTQSEKLNNNHKVTSIVCMHIPLTQTLDMFYSAGGGQATAKIKGNKYKIYGTTNQDGKAVQNYKCEDGTFVKNSYIHTTAPQNDRGFFNAILENNDVKAVIFGHEHKTNLIGSYKGILLGFAGKLSTGCYSDEFCRGGRIIKFNEKNPENFTTSWIGSMKSSIDQPKIYTNGNLAE